MRVGHRSCSGERAGSRLVPVHQRRGGRGLHLRTGAVRHRIEPGRSTAGRVHHPGPALRATRCGRQPAAVPIGYRDQAGPISNACQRTKNRNCPPTEPHSPAPRMNSTASQSLDSQALTLRVRHYGIPGLPRASCKCATGNNQYDAVRQSRVCRRSIRSVLRRGIPHPTNNLNLLAYTLTH